MKKMLLDTTKQKWIFLRITRSGDLRIGEKREVFFLSKKVAVDGVVV